MDQSGEPPRRSGSVKRAREKAAAEDRRRREEWEREYGTQPPPMEMRRQRAQEFEQGRSRQDRPPVNAMPRGQPGYGPGTSMITPQPQQPAQQWPLPAPLQMSEPRRQQQYQPPTGRGQAPQRPTNHPQQVHPSMREAPYVQAQSAQIINQQLHQGSQSAEAESYLDETSSSSMLATPGTNGSRESQDSSIGTIPEFPAPQKPTALGPPPSARRGPPSYYSANSAVTPIVEESPRVPAFDPTTSYLADKTPEERGRREQSPTFFDAGMSSDDDAHIEQGIVRSASMGRKGRPTVVQNRNSDKADQGGVLGKTRALMGAGVIAGASSKSGSQAQFQQAVQTQSRKEEAPPIPTIVHPAYREKERPQWPTFGGDDSPIENKELDMMSSDSESTLTPTPNDVEMKRLGPSAAMTGARHLTPSPSGQSSRGQLGGEMDGLNAIAEIQYNRHSAIRRPPKLNLNAVRDAEARGSLTSLPDLIRRATKLASMMNEGKRPASRLNNLNDFPMESSEKGSLAPNTRLSGLSGMLAAFPNPGANGTPLATPRSGSHWPGYTSSTKALRTPHGDSHPKRGRRCCGLPLWGFFLSLLIILGVIAAAVIIPLKLTVWKDKDTPEPAAKGLSAIEICQRDAACGNGGTSVLSGSTCGCICANGYEGSRCEVMGSMGCTTVNYFGTTSGERFEKITVGNAVPRLVDTGDANYSIPLFYENLISQFGKGEVSCSEGNALVTFNGETGAEEDTVSSSTSKASTSSTKASTTTPAPSATTSDVANNGGLGKRIDIAVDTNIELATGTATAGLAAGTSIIVAPAATATSSGSSSTSSSSSAGAKGNITISSETLDFARIAVLYIVQERGVKEGLQVQEGIINVLKAVDLSSVAKTNASMPAIGGRITWSNVGGGTGWVDLGSWGVGITGAAGAVEKKVGGRAEGGRRKF